MTATSPTTSLLVLDSLTTTFTPPATCTTLHVYHAIPDGTGYAADWGQGCTVGGGIDECYPSSWATFDYKSPGAGASAYPVYSPALACPSGWGAACSLVKQEGIAPPRATDAKGSISLTFWNSMNIGETAVGCCPGGYSCGDFGYVSYCSSDFTPGDILTLPSWGASCSEVTTTITIPADQNLGTDYAGASAFRINVIVSAGQTILPAASPTAVTTKHTASSIPPNIPSTPLTTASLPATSNNNNGSGSADDGHNTNGTGGLSQSTIIAIAVVIPVVVLAAVAGMTWFFLLRKRIMTKKKQRQEQSQSSEHGYYGKPELDASKGVTKTATPVSAVSAANLVVEMGPGSRRQSHTELPASEDGVQRLYPVHELGSTSSTIMANELEGSRIATAYELGGDSLRR